MKWCGTKHSEQILLFLYRPNGWCLNIDQRIPIHALHRPEHGPPDGHRLLQSRLQERKADVVGLEGNKRGKYAKEFCTGAPQLVFPHGHIAPADRSPELKTAGFDHSYLGYARAFDVTLPDVVKANADYYNPNRSIYYGHPIAEYQRIILPGSECPNNTAAVNLKATDAECLAYNCSDGEVVFSSPSIGEVKCRSFGEEAKGSNNKIVECPDPKSFCMRVGLRYEALDKSPFEGVGGGGIEWWVIALIVVAVVAVIAAVCITLYCFCRKDS